MSDIVTVKVRKDRRARLDDDDQTAIGLALAKAMARLARDRVIKGAVGRRVAVRIATVLARSLEQPVLDMIDARLRTALKQADAFAYNEPAGDSIVRMSWSVLPHITVEVRCRGLGGSTAAARAEGERIGEARVYKRLAAAAGIKPGGTHG